MVLIELLGAVALLLWGIRMVRTGVARAFGAKLRAFISRATPNRFAALGAGLGVTMLLQSSTATALITTSFARRGLMATGTALAVMLGADVGTAVVAQILSVSTGALAPLLLIVGVVTFMASNVTARRDIGRIAIGLGLMLLALRLIGGVSQPLHGGLALQGVLGALAGEQVVAIVVAALLTWLAHSSLATVLFVMSLAGAGIVPPMLALALVLGVNLGAAAPQITASLAEGPQARRVTFANGAFKLLGVLAFAPTLPYLAPYLALIEADPARQVLNFHVLFNLALALVMIWSTGPVARLAERLLPASANLERPGAPRYLDRSAMETPSVALTCAARETLHMGDIVESMLRQSMTAFVTDDRKLVAEIENMDNAVDQLHEAIKLYVTELTRESLDPSEGQRATEIITFTTNLEHIGDIIDKNLMELAAKKIKNQIRFSADGQAELKDFHQLVVDNLKLALGVFISGDVKIARQLIAEKVRLRDAERMVAENHFTRLREGRAESIASSALHLDVLRDFKRIHSHICAVAYPILDAAGELQPSRLKTAEAQAAGGAEHPQGLDQAVRSSEA